MITQILISFVCYLMILIGIAIFSHRRQLSGAQYIVGGRSLNFYLTALSAHASDMGAWLFMGLPTAVFISGISDTGIAIGLALGMFLNWQLVAAKLRQATEDYNSYTLPTFFEHRFDDRSGTLRILSGLMMLFYLTYYLSAALIAMGILMESVFGIDYYFGLTLSTIVMVSYTFGGGYITIAWTDLFQALFLAAAIILVPIVAFFSLDDGMATLVAELSKKEGFLSIFGTHASLLPYFLAALGWGMGYFGQPHIITKFLGIRDVREMRKSRNLGMTWQLCTLSAAVGVGLVGVAFFSDGLVEPQLIFVNLVGALFHPFVAGFILCGVLAANLSTMDSQILVCASVIGEDIYAHLSHTQKHGLSVVRASRVGTVCIALFALLLAFNKNYTIMETVYYAWAGLGSSFGPIVLMSLHCQGINRYGAIAGILTGGIVSGVWPSINPYLFELKIPSMIIAFSLSAASIWMVSRLTNKMSISACRWKK